MCDTRYFILPITAPVAEHNNHTNIKTKQNKDTVMIAMIDYNKERKLVDKNN